jgi:AcrR family transcriptional regulator
MGDKKTAILKSALDILVENGISSLRISEVAGRAEIGKGTVYEYFNSKDDLICGAVEYGLELFVGHISDKIGEWDSFDGRFNAFCDAVIDITEKGPFLSMVSGSSGIPLSPSALKKINKAFEKTMNPVFALFGEILDKGVAEGVLKTRGDRLHRRSMVTIISNAAFQNMRKGEYSPEQLKNFFREACVKLFS